MAFGSAYTNDEVLKKSSGGVKLTLMKENPLVFCLRNGEYS